MVAIVRPPRPGKETPGLKRTAVIFLLILLMMLPCLYSLAESEGPGGSEYAPDEFSDSPGPSETAEGVAGPGYSSVGPGGPGMLPAISLSAFDGPDYGPGEIVRDVSDSSASSVSVGPGGPSSGGYAQPKGPAAPKGGYKVPDGLASVPAKISGLSLPASPPPAVGVVSFSVSDGVVSAELSEPVQKMKILELSGQENAESTIFSRKETASAEAHASNKNTTVFLVRMIWKQGKTEFTREYSARSGQTGFLKFTATEALDAEAYPPYTSAVRTVYYDESGVPVSEVFAFENEKESFSRVTGYDADGNLTFVRQSWSSLVKNGYALDVVRDASGLLTALLYKGNDSDFLIRSQAVNENIFSENGVRAASRDISLFDDDLSRKYLSLAIDLGVSEGFATPTDLATATDLIEESAPLPENLRIWSLSYNRYPRVTVYAFASEDPLLIMKKNRAVLNPGAKDIKGNPLKISQKLKSASPSFDLVAIE